MPRKILDIEIDEISVVDRAANRKNFFIKKQGATPMDQLLKALNEFLGADVIKEEELAKLPLSEEQAKEIQAAVAVLSKYKADFPDDVLAAVQSLTKSAFAARPEVELTVEKIGARLSKSTMADLKKIKEILDKLIPAEEAKADEATQKAAGVTPEVAARLRKLDALEAAEAEAIRKAAADKETALTATIKKLQDDLEALKKTKGASLQKKAEGGEPDADSINKKGEPFVWTSLQGHEEA